MPPFKSMLKRCAVEVARRQRTCCHDRSRKITMGETCLVVFEGEHERFNYSRDAALAMIRRAHEQLAELEALLLRRDP